MRPVGLGEPRLLLNRHPPQPPHQPLPSIAIAGLPLSPRPDPPPLETNDVPLVAGGTALWAVAVGALLSPKLVGTEVQGWWLVMCGEGAVLGLVGVRYCLRRRDAIARDSSAQ